MATHLTVASGFAVSSAFTCRGDRPVAVFLATSHAAIGWHVAWSPDNGTTFYREATPGTAASVVWSGGVPGTWVREFPAASLGRIETSAAVSVTTSLRIVDLNRK